ncbi:N-acetyl-gamma-glutamyl-phosphate reductase [Cobetia amphilecti]|uniref:N-acetyl-gamma-glutamyl-phosphate reductase n=2 Tax=Cobetia TaxID=204286 RepID=A0ABT6UM72_9GAMM|nr:MULTISPECIES: N-acetyl-gamma-glutamyl-phosphate reductase [Cobetia]AVV34147.1 N-acetyl-gamma-glutamyl-phosphate reductase [Halomonas sp. SF2003]MBR9755123.1 N-acetyl-gamma-glutamyl-phosphate reductase [Gammaproteobacteria bacterium]TCJ24496.1 N-acetyl-gamma-glutamyl-phosphate reductase [Halomonas sp. GDM18]UTV85591.1 N-acetyl-gamma-glutamyl-phosphate reductase [Cobetia litoralis]MDI5883795.1 N-acetyl-gamma-glutamyl-phosphate reductase [Cobetia amphilecti]
MIKVGIVGGTGYTGVELLRLLASHPQVEVTVITSRSEKGVRVDEMYPNLRGHYDTLAFSEPDADVLAACDAVFFATPHGVAHALAGDLLARGTRVIDLSADFRIKDADVWAEWYGQPHGAPELLGEAVYGLPEVNRDAIREARLIAVPGCYPTSVQLGLIPLLEAGLIETDNIIADCKSAVSGAGRGAKVGSLLCEAGESMKAYGASGHRHLPEITQGLDLAAGSAVGLTFVPHLTPMIRGIHSTLYPRLSGFSGTLEDLQALFEQRYADHPAVDVMPLGSHPETRSVRGTNLCRIALHRPGNGDTLVVLSVIDNLVKGASGQAIQNLNLMFGLDEMMGIGAPAMMP